MSSILTGLRDKGIEDNFKLNMKNLIKFDMATHAVGGAKMQTPSEQATQLMNVAHY